MKRHVYLLALLLTAALLVGCGHKVQPDTDADPNAQEALPPEGITALVLSDDTQVLRFRRDDDGVWFWQDDATFPLDQAGMPALLEAAAAMTASTPVQAGDDLSEYGLDDAKTSLAVTADGETMTFTRGDQAASGDWYLLCAEDASVRLVSDDAVKIFQLLDGSIYDLAVLPTMPAITEDTLRTAVIAGADGERFTIRSADGVRKVGARDVTEKTAPLVEELSRLSVTSCVDYAPAEGAAAVCGLNAPEAILVVTYTGVTGREEALTVTIGLPTGDGGRYVTLNDEPTIYRMEEASLVQVLTLAENGLS